MLIFGVRINFGQVGEMGLGDNITALVETYFIIIFIEI